MIADFEALMTRIRTGDVDAAMELVREFEPELRRAIRIRLHGPLQRQFDSMDICQSIYPKFIMHALAGDLDLREPKNVFALLKKMAANKVTDKARAHIGPTRHPGGEQQEGSGVLEKLADPRSPSAELRARELLEQIKHHLTAEEAELLDYRLKGLQWEEIAAKVGGTADALRKKFARAMDRVAEQLNVES